MTKAKTLTAAALLLGLLAGAARAADDEAARQLRNLVYYPHAGQYRLTGAFTGPLQDAASTDNDFGVETSYRNTSDASASLSLAYGLVDGLRLVVSETDLFLDKVRSTNATTGVESTAGSHGFSDPTLTVTERYYDSPDDGFYGDVAGSFTPRLGRALAAGNGQSGNDLNGAWTATLAAPVYYRLHADGHAVEFELSPSVTRAFGGVISGSGDPSSTLTSSYWVGALALSNRYHVTDSWYVQPGVTLTFPYAFETSPQTPRGADSYVKTSYVAAPNIHVGYLPASWLLIEASVTYSGTNITTTPPASTYSVVQNQQTYGTLQVQATF